MLTPHCQELLTAYVDGELTARQRRHVARLLRRSGEARTLLRKLQTDSREINLLPVRTPPVDLSGSVLETIARRKLQPIRRPRIAAPPATLPAWTGMAAAAAVLLLVGLGSFIHFSHHPGHSGGPVVHQPAAPEGGEAPEHRTDKHIARAEQPKDELKKPPIVLGPDENPDAKNPPNPPEEAPNPQAPKPAPKPSGDPVLASGQRYDSGKFERIELPLPTFHKLDELENAGPAGKLRAQLDSAGGFRIELLCKDATRAVNRIRSALASRKIGLVIDPSAQVRLAKPAFKNDFALFLENATPQEILAILVKANQIDRTTPAGKKTPEIRFAGPVVVKEIAEQERHELRELLGVDPVGARPKASVPPMNIDIRRPLTETTAAAVADALDGKGPPRPSTTGRDNTAIVLAPTPGRGIRSPELKRFLEARKPARAGTVQVFFVLRNIGS